MYKLITLLLITTLLISCNKRSVKVTCCDANPFTTEFSGGDVVVPNVFTPNGDGTNDSFGPIANGIIDYDMTIVNTKEKVLYSTTSGGRWDGKVEGEPFNGIVGWTIELRTEDVEIVTIFGQVCVLQDTDGICPKNVDNCVFGNQATNSGSFDTEQPSNESLCIE